VIAVIAFGSIRATSVGARAAITASKTAKAAATAVGATSVRLSTVVILVIAVIAFGSIRATSVGARAAITASKSAKASATAVGATSVRLSTVVIFVFAMIAFGSIRATSVGAWASRTSVGSRATAVWARPEAEGAGSVELFMMVIFVFTIVFLRLFNIVDIEHLVLIIAFRSVGATSDGTRTSERTRAKILNVVVIVVLAVFVFMSVWARSAGTSVGSRATAVWARSEAEGAGSVELFMMVIVVLAVFVFISVRTVAAIGTSSTLAVVIVVIIVFIFVDHKVVNFVTVVFAVLIAITTTRAGSVGTWGSLSRQAWRATSERTAAPEGRNAGLERSCCSASSQQSRDQEFHV